MKKNTSDLLLLGIAHSLNHSLFLVLPPLMTTIANDLHTSFGTIGIISTITFLTYGSGALIGGPLSDRIGSLKVVKLSIGLGGLMSLVFLFANSVLLFGAGMFLMALWASFYHPTVNGLIAKAFPDSVGGSMGIHNAAGNLGQVLTPTVAFFLGVTFNWRLSFVFFGVMSVAIALLLNRIEVNEGDIVYSVKGYWQFLKTPGLWIAIIFNIFVGSLFRSIDLFFPSFLSTEKLYTGQIAAIANSMLIFFGIMGQLLGGRSSDKYGSQKTLMIFTAGIVVSLLALMVLPTNIAVPLFICLYGIFMFGTQPTVTKLVSTLSPRNMMGLAYGVMFFSSFGIGSTSTSITGWISDTYSMTTAFWVLMGLSFVLLSISVIIYLKVKSLPVSDS